MRTSRTSELRMIQITKLIEMKQWETMMAGFLPSFCRLKDETEARKELEKDIDDLKKTKEDTKLNCQQTKKEIDLVKEELARLDQEHKEVRSETSTWGNNI